MQQAHGDGFHLGRAQGVNGGVKRGLIERRHHRAARVEAFDYLEAQATRHQLRWLHIKRLVQARHADAAHLKHIAKAGRGQKRGARALAFKDRVGRHGARVQHLADRFGCQHLALDQLHDAFDHAAGIVVRRRRQLARGQPPVRKDQRDVGEGAADVGGDAQVGMAHSDGPGSKFGNHTTMAGTKVMISSTTVKGMRNGMTATQARSNGTRDTLVTKNGATPLLSKTGSLRARLGQHLMR